MSMTRTIGGDRLGSGKRMTVDLKTYERSTHDLSYIWRSTMASGTLVPYMSELGLPGDTFDIDLDVNVMTHPTVGPLFGTYKIQLDVFMVPIRLYQAKLHNNALGIGLKMADIKLPLIDVEVGDPETFMKPEELGEYAETLAAVEGDKDNEQINPSCILSYLNIRGIGRTTIFTSRQFNAIPYLGYWDIYKNYYANKQEKIGAVIHNTKELSVPLTGATIWLTEEGGPQPFPEAPANFGQDTHAGPFKLNVAWEGLIIPQFDQIIINTEGGEWKLNELFRNYETYGEYATFWNPNAGGAWLNWRMATAADVENGEPQVYNFPLENLDKMREDILGAISTPSAFMVNKETYAPYGLPFQSQGTGQERLYAKQTALEGLALKTYQSDLFNNWIETEWLDGTNGINEVTAIDTSEGSFTIDTLTLSKKVYDMLNRIAISGGTYDDWQETVYTHKGYRNAETPMYMGGLIKELAFQEVISNSEAGEGDTAQPLGTLAGRGVMTKKHKGGKITVKVDEPSYIMGIISLTPRVDYSQGNKWDVNLKTMDDLHKPALDEIGFQDLITDQMAWWDTEMVGGEPVFKSAGKQPAWVNYMTNVNQVRGNFAIDGNEMFMTLNRKYEYGEDGIQDLTTYIDPVKFNEIFAQTSRDAQNFWVQIGVDITARRKMSAKVIPNL